MAYEIGIASNYKDLLAKLIAFLTSPNTISAPVPGGSDVGDGTITGISAENAAPTETWTLVCTSGGATGTFSVTGSVSGAQANATVGTPYDNGIIAFTLNDGAIDFAIDDSFTFDVTVVMGEDLWEVLRSDDDYDGAGEDEVIFKAPGSGSDEIFVGIQTYQGYSGTYGNYYNWKLQGFTGYSAGALHDEQPGAIPSTTTLGTPRMLLWNSEIPYWFVANGRRIIVVTQVSTIYTACYLGFYLPYGLPTQMPYPLMIGGACQSDIVHYSQTDQNHRLFIDPYTGGKSSLMVLYNAWLDFLQGGNNRQVWPYYHAVQLSYDNPYDRWREMTDAVDGTPVVFPIIMSCPTGVPSREILGEMQSCAAICSDTVSPRDTVTINGDTYVVFPNIFRINKWNFWAIKLE